MARTFSIVIAGILATGAMTLFMFLVPYLGLPEMNPAQLLTIILGIPLIAGWIFHFIIGIIFAVSYVVIFREWVRKIETSVLKGLLFGIAVFVFAHIMLGLLTGVTGTGAPMEGSMGAMLTVSVIGHIIYGIVVASMIR